MQGQGITRSELAERLGTSRAFVTKLLSSHENLTMKTLVRVANALEMKVELRLRPRPVAAPPYGASGKRRVAVLARPAADPSRRTPSAAARSRKERTTR